MRDRRELLRLIELLGREFARRGMGDHVRRLRVYWLAVRHDLLGAQRRLEISWSEVHLEEWLEVLGVPPFSARLPVRARGSGCPGCGVARGTTPSGRTVLTFPGGVKLKCGECGACWVERVDEAAPSS